MVTIQYVDQKGRDKSMRIGVAPLSRTDDQLHRTDRDMAVQAAVHSIIWGGVTHPKGFKQSIRLSEVPEKIVGIKAERRGHRIDDAERMDSEHAAIRRQTILGKVTA